MQVAQAVELAVQVKHGEAQPTGEQSELFVAFTAKFDSWHIPQVLFG